MIWSVGPRPNSALNSPRLDARVNLSLAERQFSYGTAQQ